MKDWLSAVLSAILAIGSANASDKPNIIVIMADDMGYADAGFTGATDIRTPNLDALAKSGVVFRQGYVTHPFCGPSRAALMSGRYQHRFGFEANPAYDTSNPYLGIDPGEMLFPKRLQKAGYRTGAIGKWHLGAASPFHPNKRGFDYFYGFLGGGHDYFRIDLRQPVQEGYLQALVRNDRAAEFDGYLTTALSEDAARFVAESWGRPFFLYVAYNAPHTPLQAPEEAIARYAQIADKKRRVYAAMVSVMDEGIGMIVTALEKNGLRDNTLIFFLSDNGGPQNREGKGDGNGSSNLPFRGGKGDLYDGGVHVPFIASWPARIPAGSTFDAPVIAMDIARTAVEVAGADPASGPAMEGVNLIPYVLGERSGAPHDALFWRGDDGARWSILSRDGYKLLRQESNGSPELHHLPSDIGETNDIVGEKPGLAESLRKQWTDWDKANVPCRIQAYKKYHADRDQFFLQAVPEAASQGGYQPEPVPTFK